MSKISVPRLYDFQIVEVFLDLLTGDTKPPELSIENISITVGDGLSIVIGTANLEECLEANKVILDHLSNAHSYSILKISITPREHRYFLSYTRAEAGLLDFLEITPPNSYSGVQGYTASDAIATSKIHTLILKKSTLTAHPLPVDSEGLAVRGEVLAQLQKLSSDLTRDQFEYRRQIDLEKEKFVDSERQRTEARLAELSNDYKLQSELLEEQYRLQNDKLRDREQAVNDADNTTTRRETTESVLADVKEKAESFEFSNSVARGRFIVLLLSLIIATFGIINIVLGTSHFSSFPFSVKSASELSAQPIQNDFTTWLALAKIFGGSFLFISSMVYLIRYQSQWTNKAANVELDYQKFSRDLNRAHVAIEMCLEWNDKKEGQVPETLLNAMTNGLFNENTNRTEEILHPAEQLAAAMIRSAERIEFPLGNGKITTRGKDIPKTVPSST